MYHFSDIIKNKFLDEIAAMSVEQLVTSLLLSCILCLVIVSSTASPIPGRLSTGALP